MSVAAGSTGSTESARQPPVRVVIYAHRPAIREAVRTAIGRRPARDLGRIDWLEADTIDEVLAQVDRGGVDLVIVDGESQPTGGMGIARQLKYEIRDAPPVIVLVARQADRWLAHWSLADATLSFPLDPLTAAEAVAGLLRQRRSGASVVRA